jgi:hypothetical protein
LRADPLARKCLTSSRLPLQAAVHTSLDLRQGAGGAKGGRDQGWCVEVAGGEGSSVHGRLGSGVAMCGWSWGGVVRVQVP